MPASSPWIDYQAPAQHTFLGGAGDGGSVTVDVGAFDSTVHIKLAGAVLLALVVIFALQAMDFRFVVSGNATLGVG